MIKSRFWYGLYFFSGHYSINWLFLLSFVYDLEVEIRVFGIK